MCIGAVPYTSLRCTQHEQIEPSIHTLAILLILEGRDGSGVDKL